jgi:hypothetical protein
MALRGSLHEFELAEIFQLISRDAKTGQLVLSHQDNEAFVIFSQGAVVAAGTGEQNLQTILFRYLMSVKRYSEEELNELLYICQGEMRQFSQELTKRNYLSGNELATLVHMTIEDLACSLFLWDEGNYRFDSLEGMDEYLVGGVTFPVDAITMEAMRRSDEWKRIRQHISGGTVFSVVQQPPAPQAPASPLSNPSGYVLSLIDGLTTVDGLCEKSLLLPYRVYEILFGLWQNSAISPLAVKRQQVKPRPAPSGRPASEVVAAALSITAVAVWAAALFCFSHIAGDNFLHQTTIDSRMARATVEFQRNVRKTAIAALQFRSLRGYSAANAKSLVLDHLIGHNDVPLQVPIATPGNSIR